MVNLFLSIVVVVLVFLQLIYPHALSLFGIRPDLLLIPIIFLSLYSKHMRTFFWAVISGGLKDLISADIFGMHLLNYSLIAVVVSFFEARFFLRDKPITLSIFIASVALLAALLENLLQSFFSPAHYSFFTAFRIIIFQTIITTLWALPLIYILKRCALKFFISQ